MTNFYGRKIPRGAGKEEIKQLFNCSYFFHKEKKIDLRRNLLSFSRLNLEIGFGSGENLINSAQERSDEIFIGCDPYLRGSLLLRKKIESMNIKNVILTNLSFLELFEYIKNIYFKKILILFPDPWPKKRHLKRRLINKNFLTLLDQISNQQTDIIISTDNVDYQNQILYLFYLNKNFIPSTEIFGKKLFNYFGLKETKYYQKAKKSKNKSYFFLFNKRN